MVEKRRLWLFFYDYFCSLPLGMKLSSLAWMRCWYKSRTNHRTEMRGAWQITASWNYITLNLWENNLPYQVTSPKLAPADWSQVYLSRKPFESFVCLDWRYLVWIFPWDFSFTEPYFWYLTPTLIHDSFLYCPRSVLSYLSNQSIKTNCHFSAMTTSTRAQFSRVFKVHDLITYVWVVPTTR